MESVQVSQSSMAKAWRQMGGDDTWLQLRTSAGTLENFEAAVEEANAAAEARGEGSDAFGAFPTYAPRGFAVQLIRASTFPAVRRWVADLEPALTERGFVGRLGGASEAPVVPVASPSLPPVLTGFVAWRLDPALVNDASAAEAGWLVDEGTTERICALADRWARRDQAQIHLTQNTYTTSVQLGDTSAQLARAVSRTGMAGVEFIVDPARYATHAALSFGGDGVFQLYGETDWRASVHQLTDALVALPADLNHAYIRPAIRYCISHVSVGYRLPLPDIDESDVRYNKHLLDRYLPDAHGVQVVCTAHLDNATDLSDWQITDLGSGRHLVQTPDLEPWYANTLPDPDVLAEARADFAGALLTKEIIAANPAE